MFNCDKRAFRDSTRSIRAARSFIASLMLHFGSGSGSTDDSSPHRHTGRVKRTQALIQRKLANSGRFSPEMRKVHWLHVWNQRTGCARLFSRHQILTWPILVRDSVYTEHRGQRTHLHMPSTYHEVSARSKDNEIRGWPFLFSLNGWC